MVLVVIFISLYNTLITLKHRVDNAWSQIDVQLQRRFDLIPNLVETVKGYAKHEEGVLEKVTSLRSGFMNASTPGEKSCTGKKTVTSPYWIWQKMILT